MAGAGRYAVYTVDVDGTDIDQITSVSFSPNPQVQRMAPLGDIDPTAVVKVGQMPTFRFTTTKVDVALDTIGISGLDVSSGIELGFIERSQGGSFEAGGEKVSASKCLIIPETLTVNQDGIASITYTAMPYSSDGTTAPIAHAASLPTATPTANEYFTLGSVTISAAALGQPTGWSLNFGISAEILKSAGQLYGTKAIIRSRAPTCDLRVADMGELSSARLLGSEVTTTVFNLIKLSATGGGLAGSGDKTITFANAYMVVGDGGGSSPGDADISLHFEARKASAIMAIT
jgi:hypothetical protein